MFKNEAKNWQVRQTAVEIDLLQLEKNFYTLKRLAKSAEIVALAKSNAYGHSLAPVALHLDKLPKTAGLHGFAVANVEEGIELRRSGVKRKIYILSGIQQSNSELLHCLHTCNLTPVISSLRVLEGFIKASSDTGLSMEFHLKLNTGMNRLGLDLAQVPRAIKIIQAQRNLTIDGLLSHYATAEKPNSKITRLQTKRFRDAIAQFNASGISLRYTHMENSFGLENNLFPDGNLARLGLHLYGEGSDRVAPVARWTAQVYDVREVPKGEGIGYGPLFYTKKKSRIAILGVGYGDGYPRALSNRAEVLIHGKRCKVVGAISMDLTAVDVTNVKGVTPETKAVLLGKDRKDRITAVELAERAKCIPWEILTGISARVPRAFKA